MDPTIYQMKRDLDESEIAANEIFDAYGSALSEQTTKPALLTGAATGLAGGLLGSKMRAAKGERLPNSLLGAAIGFVPGAIGGAIHQTNKFNKNNPELNEQLNLANDNNLLQMNAMQDYVKKNNYQYA